MSVELIGIEGSVPNDAVVTWGAGALLVDDVVINTITRRRLSQQAALELRDQGLLHFFDRRIEIDARFAESDLVVLMVSAAAALGRHFLTVSGKTAGLAKVRTINGWQCSIFEDRVGFEAYAADVAQQVLNDVLYDPNQRTAEAILRHRSLVRYALTLVPSHPTLNATRAYLNRSNPSMAQIARSSVKGEFDTKKFDLFLAALNTNRQQKYELQYDLGNATGGGFDVPVAVHTLQAVQKATKTLEPSVAQQYPFLNKVPPTRFYEMQAASAHLFFVAQATEHDLLGDRVARFLALDLLQQALRGEVELKDANKNRVLETAIRKIARPTEETSLSQKPIQSDSLEPVNVYTPHEEDEPLRSEQLEILGAISGLSEDRYAELWFPNCDRIEVATDDNGDGEVPRGADTLTREGSFLRKPCVVSLVREHVPGEEAGYLLRQIRVLQPNQSIAVTAFASAVVEGAFLTGLRLNAQITGGVLSLRSQRGMEVAAEPELLAQIENATQGTLESCTAMIEALAAAATRFELREGTEAVRRVTTTRRVPAAQLYRLLTVLSARGGRGYVADLLSEVAARFGKPMRAYHISRVIQKFPHLIQHAVDDREMILLTEEGALHFRAYRLAGGATQAIDQADEE